MTTGTLLPHDQRRRSHPSSQTRHHPPPHLLAIHRGSLDSAQHIPMTPLSAQYSPRPHPHLHAQVLFIDHVPSDLPEQEIAQALQECLPVRITLGQSVPPHLRLKPDAYYDWMPRSGKLEFDQQHNAEKALAILHIHPLFASRGITISPFPSPQLVPLAESPARHLRPTLRVMSPPPPIGAIRDPLATCPSPGKVFDSLRPWGSLRMVQVWAEIPPEGTAALPAWSARVEFWHEDEAKRFEVGFGQTASVINGWQIAILTELPSSIPILQPLLPPILPLQLPPTPGPITAASSQDMKFITPIPYPHHPFDPAPGGALQAAIGVTSHASQQHAAVNAQIPFPDTPPHTAYTPPWASHNPFTISQTDMPGPLPGLPFPIFPTSPPALGSPGLPSSGSPMTTQDRHIRHLSSMSRASMSSLRSSVRQRTWSVTTGPAPDGGIRATGLVSDDGQFIAHGPGQHIRPAPMYGPGSNSVSGLVDYSNVFVKNLDADINSEFLTQLFSNVGRIVSARVMRDELNRSRGYGFVSFHTPEEALRAVNAMHGQQVGQQLMAVTLHEPRKLRPEKIAERTMREQPTAYGRAPLHQASLSSLRGAAHPHTSFTQEQIPASARDDIRLLSPKTRAAALTRRVMPKVKAYAREHAMSDSSIMPIVKTLVAEDLQIIPLLHDCDRFGEKINETIKRLERDPEVVPAVNDLKMSTPPRAGPVTRSVSRATAPHVPSPSGSTPDADGSTSRLGLNSEDLEIIRSEIQAIDVVDAETIMAMLLSRLTPERARKCLKNRQHLRLTANGIRREILRSRMKIDTGVTQLVLASDLPPLSGLSQPSPVSSPIRRKPGDSMDIDPKPVLVRLSVDEIDIDKLATLPIEHALAHFDGEEGKQVLEKLSLGKISGTEISAMDDFIKRVRRKSPLERRSEVVTLIARALDYPALRKSQKAKLASDLVNTEDNDEAVCRLTLYPALLEAKVGQLLGSPLSRRVSA